jgi:hypothetical protein
MRETLAKDDRTGLTLYLDVDPTLIAPTSDGIKMAVLHRRYVNPGEGELDTQEQIEAFEADCFSGIAPWAVYPLYLYDHSGTLYKVGKRLLAAASADNRPVNPFSCPWDSGRVGTLFVLAQGEDRFNDPDAAAAGHCADYTAWANGDGYGWWIENSAGAAVASSGGYLGYDGAQAAREDGQAEFNAVVIEERAKLDGADGDLDLARKLYAERQDLASAKRVITLAVAAHRDGQIDDAKLHDVLAAISFGVRGV